MNFRKYLLEAITLIAAAVLCAAVSNAIASRERKVALVGEYPNALKVPVETPPPAAAALAPAITTTESATVAVPPAPTMPMTVTIAPAAAKSAPAPAKSSTTSSAVTKTTTTASPAPTPAAPAPVPNAKETLARFKPHPDKAYLEVSYPDVAALHNAGALFLDARRTSVYEQGHIAEARPFSVWESDVDDKLRKLFDERGDPAQQALPIVVYCSGGECEDSHMLAQKLWGAEFNNVYVYRDGFPDWQKHGGAVHAGATP